MSYIAVLPFDSFRRSLGNELEKESAQFFHCLPFFAEHLCCPFFPKSEIAFMLQAVLNRQDGAVRWSGVLAPCQARFCFVSNIRSCTFAVKVRVACTVLRVSVLVENRAGCCATDGL